MIDGVTYEIDLSQPSRYDSEGVLVDEGASRIKNLAFEGAPVDPAQRFAVATNNYRAGGGGSFPGITSDKIIFVGPDTNRDIIVRYIIEQGEIDPAADGNWRFSPLPDTTVVFDTGPAAADVIADVEGVAIEEAGAGENGFARYRITL